MPPKRRRPSPRTPKEPSPDMLRDLHAVFKKHNWSGHPVGIMDLEDSNDCPPGTTPKEVTVKLPDGTTVTKTICV